jgi:hypothetical protein
VSRSLAIVAMCGVSSVLVLAIAIVLYATGHESAANALAEYVAIPLAVIAWLASLVIPVRSK